MTAQDIRGLSAATPPTTTQIAFLAISQAHQFLHWLPAALRLGAEPGVQVTVLVSSRAAADFVRSFDPEKRLLIERLWAPSLRRHGLFSPPLRLPLLLLNGRAIGRYPTIVTTEVTSAWLRRFPRFRSGIINLKHGAGDREGGYRRRLAEFDLTLVTGPKDKQRHIERGLATEENCVVTGYGKFELVQSCPEPIFPNDRPIALYNPHFDWKLGSWRRHGRQIVAALEAIPGWNFVVAPHVKLRGGPAIRSDAEHILIDRGSMRSINMAYTQAAGVYIGDASSQVYEFIRTPRPCIFLNLDRIDWRANPAYAHWQFGQVIESVGELPAALARAHSLQSQFAQVQIEMFAASIDQADVSASQRQAQAILDFARRPREG